MKEKDLWVKILKKAYKDGGEKVISLMDFFREEGGILDNYDGNEDDFYILDDNGNLYIPFTINKEYVTVKEIKKSKFGGKVTESKESIQIKYDSVDCTTNVLCKFIAMQYQTVMLANSILVEENERLNDK